MEKANVESSSVTAIGYDAFSSVLEVEFKNGRVYQYAQVPKRTYSSLMKSKSKGKFMFRSIKDQYDYREVLSVEDVQISRAQVHDALLTSLKVK